MKKERSYSGSVWNWTAEPIALTTQTNGRPSLFNSKTAEADNRQAKNKSRRSDTQNADF